MRDSVSLSGPRKQSMLAGFDAAAVSLPMTLGGTVILYSQIAPEWLGYGILAGCLGLAPRGRGGLKSAGGLSLPERQTLEQILVLARLRAPVLLGRKHMRAQLRGRVPRPARVVQHRPGQ